MSPLSDRCGIAKAIATDPATDSPKGKEIEMEASVIYLYFTSGENVFSYVDPVARAPGLASRRVLSRAKSNSDIPLNLRNRQIVALSKKWGLSQVRPTLRSR